jgi:hypothetical protein
LEGSVIQVYRIPVPKERLGAMAKNERVLLLLLGYVSNQLSIMLVRPTVGALNEAWELVRTRFIETTMAKDYLNLLDASGQGSLRGPKTPVWRVESSQQDSEKLCVSLPAERRRGEGVRVDLQ